MQKKLHKTKAKIVLRYNKTSKKVLYFIDKYPLKSFFVALAIVFVLIVIGNIFPKPQNEIINQQPVKTVNVYKIGSVPKITVSAQIRKTGVIQIVSQVSGIVNYINVFEGTKIGRGTNLFSISSNYYGANAAGVQREIAQKQYDTLISTFQTQKDLLQKQKDLANKSYDNADELRNITSKANAEIESLISLNDQILASIEEQLNALPIGSTSAILALKQMKAQYLASNNQAKSSLRNNQYMADSAKPGFELNSINRDIALKQLEIQEKQLETNKEITNLQLALARINEGMYYPSSPFSGVVERVFVKPFETVNPGTPLAVISQSVEDDPVTAIAFVGKDVAERVSQLEDSILHIGKEKISIKPSYVTTEAVSGSLYAIYYPIPENYNKALTNDGYISIDIPVGYPDTGSAAPFVPIDSIYQTRSKAYLFVVEEGKAKSREVVLGEVFGRFVEIESGIKNSDMVITDRNVIDGDFVTLN